MMGLSLYQDLIFNIFIIMARISKSKLHKSIVNDYDLIKNKHLEKLASQMLKNDDKTQKLKDKKININILNLF